MESHKLIYSSKSNFDVFVKNNFLRNKRGPVKRSHFSSSGELMGAWMILAMLRSGQSQDSFLRRLHNIIIDCL